MENNIGIKRKAGRPKGTNNPRTLEKIAQRKYMEERIMKAHRNLLTSQIHIAQGVSFLYKIEKKYVEAGKLRRGNAPEGNQKGYWQNLPPKLVTAQWEIESYLENIVGKANGDIADDFDPAATFYFITTKEPNNEAIKDLLNRLHGKPTENVKLDGEVAFSLIGLAKRREELKNPEQEAEIVVPQQITSHEDLP